MLIFLITGSWCSEVLSEMALLSSSRSQALHGFGGETVKQNMNWLKFPHKLLFKESGEGVWEAVWGNRTISGW